MSPIWFPGMVHADEVAARRTSVVGPALAVLGILAVMALLLWIQGRLWICSCGQVYLWAGDISSAHNSQHLSDPYSFTHILHGIVLFWIIAWLVPTMSLSWRLALAVAAESLWEVVENSSYAIDRYREATIALGYEGDTILNSFSDVGMCVFGFLLCRRVGGVASVAIFIALEGILTFWVRDGLLLNILMLLYPTEAVRTWQGG